ncbi:ABC transporter ATP-binding protein [Aquamicrobium sp. LC103]|uniref:ABC transporter ATP-binding protein n=1 Tax=Aquamicrobium sp. LC103 TaxID=1120658 RepID=UPI000ADF5AF4|nr:ABC transporter ATP-binding protein [Aquamicrobium sp. LC103]
MSRSDPENPLIDVRNLTVTFPVQNGHVRPVDEVSFSIGPGETVAMVGESGSGKSVTSLAIMGLLPPQAQVGGQILWRNNGKAHDLAGLPQRAMRRIRGNDIAMIFQEPMTSLNPLHSVGRQIIEAIRLHRSVSRAQARELAESILELVGLPEPARQLDRWPHEMSGGQRQRVMIAMALAGRPALLIADEPTTALDVTIQAQILDLLRRLQTELGMSMLFITHDLGVVAEIADRMVVIYAGRIVESGRVEEVLSRPTHPYTRGLLRSVPAMKSAARRLEAIPGMVPDLAMLPPGCRFAPRCRYAQPSICDAREPALENAGQGRSVRCVRWREIEEAVDVVA